MQQRGRACLFVLALAAACARHDSSLGSLSPGKSTPRFETRIEIATGQQLHSDYAVGDFNGDGDVDMAVVDFDGVLQVMIGSGPVFVPGQTLFLGGSLFWIDRGDFDHDGDLDLAVLQKDGFAVSVLRNDGNAQFTRSSLFDVGPDCLQVLATDANQDGNLDLLVARIHSPAIEVFVGDGTGRFVPGQAIQLPGGGEALTLAVGDPTHDGVPDLVVCDADLERVLVFPGQSATNDFAAAPTILSVPGMPGWSSVGDLNGDGRDDIAVSAWAQNRFVVITAIGTPVPSPGTTPYESTQIGVQGHASGSCIGDVTGDGRADLVACVVDRASIVVVPQLPTGGLGELQQLDATGQPSRPVVVDVDHNRRNDVLALGTFGNRINLWLSLFSGRLIGGRSYGTNLFGGGLVVAADLDRDGVAEVIAGSPDDSRLSVLRADGQLELTVVQQLDLVSAPRQVRVADFDVDGRPDLFVTVQGGVKIVRNRSTAAGIDLEVLPASNGVFGGGQGPLGAAVADLDRDGRLDLAIADFDSGDLQILRGGSSPFDFSAPPQFLPIGGAPLDVAAADFTGDGIVDLAVSRNALSDIVLLRNDGNGTLSPQLALPVGAAPNVLLTGDLDRDGRGDLVVANGDGDSVTVLFGGAAGFTGRSYAAGDLPTALAVDDLTGDGLLDVLVAGRFGDDFRVLVNDGVGGFANVFAFPGARGSSAVALADFDHDGDRDLVMASVLQDRISVVRSLQVP